MSTTRLCTFAVGGLLLGLPVEDVREVVRDEHVTPVPLAPAAVAGLLNLRGRIVPVLDARRRLGLPARGDDEQPAHVVLDVDGEHVSLVVDREGEVVVVADEERQAVPETVDPLIRRLSTAAFQREDGLLLVLDPRRVLSLS